MYKSYEILNSINSLDDFKRLPADQLNRLAHEIRAYIIEVVSENGGHLASNLGVIELTIALHRVFNSPVDKIIWDVGHQSYTHKILTGRRERFQTLRQLHGISGFPRRTESVHDIFDTGHASTSISAGLGILVGQDLQNNTGKVIAVIGDGSLTGGMALEGLNQTGHFAKNLIIILNDNEMSISKNVGALSSYLSQLSATVAYQTFRAKVEKFIKGLPLIGNKLGNLISRMLKGIKAIILKETLFTSLGFEYVGPIDGHNIELLTDVLKKVRKLPKPVVVHIITRKGKGYVHAEGNPSLYHGVGAFSIIDGKLEKKRTLSFTDVFSKTIVKLAEEDSRVTAITAAMSAGTGLGHFKEKFPERFFDVGITEQHAVTFSAGLAVSGLRPFVAIYSTFMQRSVDQVIHDAALPALPVVFCLDRAGLVDNDGETHQGVFDIPLFRSIPNITFLAPANGSELEMMLYYSLTKNSPVIIRYPKAISSFELNELNVPLIEGRGVLIRKKPGEILIITVGSLIEEAYEAHKVLLQYGITMDIYNLRFIKPFDEDYLLSILKDYSMVITIEDGAVSGGIGEKIKGFAASLNITCESLGIPDIFIQHGSRTELLSLYGLHRNNIVALVKKMETEQRQNPGFKLRLV